VVTSTFLKDPTHKGDLLNEETEKENKELKQKVKRLEEAKQEISNIKEGLVLRVQSLVEEVKFYSSFYSSFLTLNIFKQND
jgi:hypothetical protein